MPAIAPLALAALKQELAGLPPPIVVFNKSHSGSRLVARVLSSSGVFMGSRVNVSADAEPFLPLVETAVERSYPDYASLWRDEDLTTLLAGLGRAAIAEHLGGYAGGRWGWKLCETVYALPLIDYLFPDARYVHVIRDGRDVAFSDHVPPKDPYWQKVYVDAVGVKRWRGLYFGRHSRTGYRLDSSLYNTQHWVNSVTLGRRYGAMLRDRYLEVRYETLCQNFDREAERLLDFAGVEYSSAALAAVRADVSVKSIGKHRKHGRWRVSRVERYARPLLTELGYLDRK